jgi:hypothetical protein
VLGVPATGAAGACSATQFTGAWLTIGTVIQVFHIEPGIQAQP